MQLSRWDFKAKPCRSILKSSHWQNNKQLQVCPLWLLLNRLVWMLQGQQFYHNWTFPHCKKSKKMAQQAYLGGSQLKCHTVTLWMLRTQGLSNCLPTFFFFNKGLAFPFETFSIVSLRDEYLKYIQHIWKAFRLACQLILKVVHYYWQNKYSLYTLFHLWLYNLAYRRNAREGFLEKAAVIRLSFWSWFRRTWREAAFTR